MVTDGGGSSLEFPDVPKLELDQLIDQLVVNAQSVRRAQGRLRALLHAIETVTRELTLETVLHNIVEAARELASAQYAALGVISHDRTLEQFLYVGIDEQTAARIGHLPRGRGLLGALITNSEPIRLPHMAEDQRSSGFPPNHPAMDSFLGVPISARGEVFGNIYLTNSANGEFSTEDEELVIALAQAAGTAISNARLYQEAQLKQRWLEASGEISAAMLATGGEDPLRIIARRALDLADADAVSVSLLSVDRRNLVVEVALGAAADELVGRRFATDATLGGQVAQSGTPALVADALSGDTAALLFASVIDAGPVMVLPLSGTGRPRGALSLVRVAGRRPFSPADLAMAAGFAGQASVALELADTRAAEQKLVLLEDRDRIARDLHDHVIQELFSIGLSLEGAAGQLPEGKVAQRVQRAIENIDRTIRRIRTSIFQLRGNFVDNEGGLRQRILEVVSDLATPLGFVPHTAFAGLVDEAFDGAFAEDILACIRESLTNTAKHAHATSAWIDVVAAGDEVTLTVSDDGVGPGDASRSSGIANMRARAERRHGSLEIERGPSGGTVVTWKARIT
jgi:signal transduction histidine kinase